jgi:hypothetical protein
MRTPIFLLLLIPTLAWRDGASAATVRVIDPGLFPSKCPGSGDCSSVSVCVVTSYEAIQEPRAPRHAIPIAELIPASRVTFIDCAPDGKTRPDPQGRMDAGSI